MNNINITNMPGGLRVVSEFIPYVQSFSLGFWFNIGSVAENKSNNGITHFIEHMVFKGTKKRSAKRISDDVESLGGYLNAFTAKEHTCFYGRGLTKHIDKTFDVIADMVQNARFAEKDIVNEASVVVDELYDIEDSPEEMIFESFETELYKGNSLSLPIIGTEKNIRKFQKADLQKFVRKNYSPENLTIVAAGNIEHEKLLRMVEKAFVAGKKKKSLSDKKITIGKSQNLFVKKDIQQAHVLIGTTAPGFSDKNRVKVALLSHILGEGSSSRLFQSLREKNGIAYHVNSFLNSFYDISSIGIYFSTSNKQISKSTDIIQKELEKIKSKDVSERELKRAKEYLKGNLLMSLESVTNRMIRIGNSVLYYNKVKTPEESINEIEKVTIADIRNYANKFLNYDKMLKFFVGQDEEVFNKLNQG